MTTKLVVTIKHQTTNTIQHDKWDVEPDKLWIIGNIDEMGNNELEKAKPFTCISEFEDENEEESFLQGMVRPRGWTEFTRSKYTPLFIPLVKNVFVFSPLRSPLRGLL